MPRESGPSTPDRHLRRKRVDQLVDVKNNFPPKLPKRLADIITRVAHFEDIALELPNDSNADLDFIDMMLLEGVPDAEFIQSLESSSKMLRAYIESNCNALYRTTVVTRGATTQLASALNEKAFNQFTGRVNANMNGILRAIAVDRRPVAHRYIKEIQNYTLQLHVADRAMTEGPEFLRGFQVDPTYPEEQRTIANTLATCMFASAFREAHVRETTHAEALALLRDSAFLATSLDGVRVPIPDVKIFSMPTWGTITTYDPQAGLILGAFTVMNPHNNKPLAIFKISRITGELITEGMHVLSAEAAFSVMGKQDVYVRLRDAALSGMLHAIESGALKEKPYIILDDAEHAVMYRTGNVSTRPVDTGVVPRATLPEPEPSTPAPEVHVDHAAPVSDVHEPSPQAVPSIAEQIAAMNEPQRARERKVVHRERRITWPRVLRAFERLRVTVTFRAHPILSYNGSTTRYLNAHDTDTEHARRELYRALADLGIERDDFFRALK